ncbi:Man1-Src1p-C-terminal domain containing protein [Naviculisporaceae sp. PSN 640]
MSDEEYEYLQPGFDPNKLTVPRLRSLFVKHDIQYPGVAKKADLVELFHAELAPQARKILARAARVKRMSQGIVDAGGLSSTSTDFDDNELMPPPQPTPRARSPRKTTRLKRESEDPEHLAPTPRAPIRESPRKRSSRSVSTAPTVDSNNDTDTGAENEVPMSVRKRQVRPSTPAVKSETTDHHDFFKKTPQNEDIFSNDNPFQRGSNSPPMTKTPSNRRKTTGMDSVTGKSTPATRRKTDFTTSFDDDDQTLVSRSFEAPLNDFMPRKSKTPEPPTPVFESTVEPDEEFTPEEQLALAQEERANPQLAVARRKPSEPRSGTSFTTPIWVLMVTLLGAYAAWYRQEKIAVGYCDLGREPRRLLPSTVQVPEWATELAAKAHVEDFQSVDINVPDWAVPYIEPQCEPCPLHAYCYEDFTTRCEPDYLLKPHPLSLGGLIPLPPTCEPDGEKARRVKTIADKAVEELRERRARFECGDSAEPDAPPPESPAIEEQELKQTLSQKRNKRMAAEEFDELWSAAIGEVKAREEVKVEVEEPQPPANETGGSDSFPTTLLSSTSLARLSYTCAARRQVKLGLARHRLSIVGMIFTLLAIFEGRRRFIANRALAAKIPGLVDEVLERLANQKELAFDSAADEDAFLFLPNLRDDVLRSLHRLSDREALWQRVRVVVEQNSNVRTGNREGRNGEVGRAWEWIGPSRPSALGDGSGSRSARRKSARVSWGPDVKGEENESEDMKKLLASPSAEMAERRNAAAGTHKKWEEGRPIF